MNVASEEFLKKAKENGIKYYNVEKILGHHRIGKSNKFRYFCKWVGYGEDCNGWSDEIYAPTLISQYWEEKYNFPASTPSDSEEDEIDNSAAGDENVIEPVEILRKDSEVKKNSEWLGYRSFEVAKFLEIIKKKENRAIWDSSHDDFHNKATKNGIFEFVEMECSKFMPKGSKRGDNAKKLWKELLLLYKEERMKMKDWPPESGRFRSEFRFFGNMFFLEPIILTNEEVSNDVVQGPSESQEVIPEQRNKNGSRGVVQGPSESQKVIPEQKNKNGKHKRKEELECSACQTKSKKRGKNDGDLFFLMDLVISQKHGLEKVQLKNEISEFLLSKIIP